MNNRFEEERDGFDHRLLLFIQKKSGLSFINIKRLKKGVWLLSTATDEQWVAKEFSSLSKFLVQESFTRALYDQGFCQTYRFLPKPFMIENRVFGLIDYIEPSESLFHYDCNDNISDALQLLVHFHMTTTEIISPFRNRIPYFHQLDKWERRLKDFNRSINLHKHSPAYSYLQQFAEIGVWALRHLYDDEDFFINESNCIIHGDVANHNFVRGKEKNLYLIDFDLISVAPAQIDLLQMCSRILPGLNWNAERLFSFESLHLYKDSRPFLAALIYPTDIFREWNHFVKCNETEQQRRWGFLENLTFNGYKERIQFYSDIIGTLGYSC